MKEYKNIYDQNSAKSFAKLLTIITSLLALAALICTLITKMSVLSKVLLAISFVCEMVMVGYYMHYIKYACGCKKSKIVLHTLELHLLFSALALLAGKFNTFSFVLIHSIIDGLLAGLMLEIITNKVNFIVYILGFVVALVVSLFQKDVIVNILFVVLAIILFVTSLKKTKKPFGYFGIFTGIVVAIFAVISLVTKNSDLYHVVLHFVSALVSIALCVVPSLLKVEIPETTRTAPENKEVVEVERTEEKTEEQETEKETETDKDLQNRNRWIIKQYKDLPLDQLMDAPVNALWGVSDGDAQLLKDAFNIKTVGDLATSKYFLWACEIVEEAEKE